MRGGVTRLVCGFGGKYCRKKHRTSTHWINKLKKKIIISYRCYDAFGGLFQHIHYIYQFDFIWIKTIIHYAIRWKWANTVAFCYSPSDRKWIIPMWKQAICEKITNQNDFAVNKGLKSENEFCIYYLYNKNIKQFSCHILYYICNHV